MPSASDTETPIVRIEPSRGWISLNLRALWGYRELLYFLIWREVKIRYKQTVIGLAWVILQPLITILIFTVVFSHFARIPSDGIPYPIFAYTGLLPWSYFASAVGRAGNSLLGDAQLLEKVYFPRPIIPISSVVSPLVDFIFGFLVLLGMVMLYGYAPSTGTTSDSLTRNTQGTSIVTWTYDDGHGNTFSQTQNIVVKDTISPVPNVASLPDATGECSATISAPPTATDNCSGTITATTTDSLTRNTQGTSVVTWSFDDGNGNVSLQTQNIVVKDNTAPVPNEIGRAHV